MKRQLLFEVGDHLFAVDALKVREVIEPREATPIPGAISGVLGLINLHGSLLVAGDLEALLGLAASEHEEEALIVFEQGERRIAARVDRVVGVAPDSEDDAAADVEPPSWLRSELLCGNGVFGERIYSRLDVGAIFASMLAPESEESTPTGSVGGQ